MIPANKISAIPLSYRIPNTYLSFLQRNRFGFCNKRYVSVERKNVMRLIDAAIKYKFKLFIGVNNPKEFELV